MSRDRGRGGSIPPATRRLAPLAAALALGVLAPVCAQGARVNAFIETEALASDNIARLAQGQKSGTVWTLLGGAETSGENSILTWNASAATGQEKADNREESAFRAAALLSFPLGTGCLLETSAGASRSTALAEGSGDLTREPTRQRNAGLSLGRSWIGGSSLKGGGEVRAIERAGLSLDSIKWSLAATHTTGPRVALSLAAARDVAFAVEEVKAADRERRTVSDSAGLSLTVTGSPLLKWGADLTWARSSGRVAGSGDDPRSDDLGARLFVTVDLSPTAHLTAGTGGEGLKNEGEERVWGGRGDLGLSLGLSPDLALDTRAEHRLFSARTAAGALEWTRRTTGEATLEWKPYAETTFSLRAQSQIDAPAAGGPDIRENLVGLTARQQF